MHIGCTVTGPTWLRRVGQLPIKENEELGPLRSEPSSDQTLLVGMPGFAPDQPVPGSIDASTVVRLTCMFTVVVCWHVRVYAQRL